MKILQKISCQNNFYTFERLNHFLCTKECLSLAEIYFLLLINLQLQDFNSIKKSVSQIMAPNCIYCFSHPITDDYGDICKCSAVLFYHTFLFFKFYLFIYGNAGSLLLHTGFLQLWRMEGYSLLLCSGFSLPWLLLLGST